MEDHLQNNKKQMQQRYKDMLDQQLEVRK